MVDICGLIPIVSFSIDKRLSKACWFLFLVDLRSRLWHQAYKLR